MRILGTPAIAKYPLSFSGSTMTKMELYREWVEKVRVAPICAMSDEVTKLFVGACIQEHNHVSMSELTSTISMCKIIQSRAEYIGLTVNDHVALFLSCLCSSPGNAVMFVYSIKGLTDATVVTLEVLAEIFPVGFPHEDVWSNLWDAQKRNGSNLLDFISAEDFRG